MVLNLVHHTACFILNLVPAADRNKRILKLLLQQRQVRLVGLHVESLVNLPHANLQVFKVLVKGVNLFAKLLKLWQKDVLQLVDVVEVSKLVNLSLHFLELQVCHSLRLHFVDVVLDVLGEGVELSLVLLQLDLELLFDLE